MYKQYVKVLLCLQWLPKLECVVYSLRLGSQLLLLGCGRFAGPKAGVSTLALLRLEAFGFLALIRV